MAKIDFERIERAIAVRDAEALAIYLRETSNLPGPRGNLEVAAVVAGALGEVDPNWTVEAIEQWSLIEPKEAGGNDPGVMLPFTAAQAAGVLWVNAGDAQRGRLNTILHRAANDPRWRVREGAAMGLQRIGFADFQVLRALLDSWSQHATLLDWRAIVAGLAEPPLLTASDCAEYGLDRSTDAIEALLALPSLERRSDEAQALRKALGYALSVFIAVDPTGFDVLEALARRGDRDAEWIVRENLKKARITRTYPDECRRIAGLMTR